MRTRETEKEKDKILRSKWSFQVLSLNQGKKYNFANLAQVIVIDGEKT